MDKCSIHIPSQSIRLMVLHAFFLPFLNRVNQLGERDIFFACHFDVLPNSRALFISISIWSACLTHTFIFVCILSLLDEHGISV